jgi:hypothetical protein
MQLPAKDKMFTADGVEIVDGLRVWTNNLDRATVIISDRFRPWAEKNENNGHVEGWFYVVLDSKNGNAGGAGNQIMSESRVATMFEGKRA